MTDRARLGLLLAVLAAPLAACGDDLAPDGALVAVTAATTVGVLLDDLPEDLRDAAAADYLGRDDAFWRARAERQIDATGYRLIYRGFYYDEAKGQLPLPPRSTWRIELGDATRVEIDGHDLVAVDVELAATILTGAEQPGAAEPMLAEVGGTWDEAYLLPVDPDLLLERTGYACVDESDFPPGSADTENVRFFYDDYCEAGVEDGCHITAPAPTESCVEAVERAIGGVETTLRFERLAWDPALAAEVRVLAQRPGGAQLHATVEGLEDHRIVYRYVDADSCAISEGCVTGSGWRRLLQFTATMQNLGDEPVTLGEVGPGSPAAEAGMVSLSECHGHYHFNHYGRFGLGDDPALGGKRAFCIESTTRFANNEDSPLVHEFSCDNQGTAVGWGDDYIAGLDCQWIDITDVEVGDGATTELAFEVNPDGFLCEGELVLGDDDEMTFVASDFENELGEPERKVACEPVAGAADDNLATLEVELPAAGGGLVTSPCERGTPGERRNCDFGVIEAELGCLAGEPVTVRCTLDGGDPQAIRVCERSAALDVGVPCTYLEALGSASLVDGTVDLELGCPSARDAREPGGAVAVFAAPLLDGDDAADVSCTIVPVTTLR